MGGGGDGGGLKKVTTSTSFGGRPRSVSHCSLKLPSIHWNPVTTPRLRRAPLNSRNPKRISLRGTVTPQRCTTSDIVARKGAMFCEFVGDPTYGGRVPFELSGGIGTDPVYTNNCSPDARQCSVQRSNKGCPLLGPFKALRLPRSGAISRAIADGRGALG